MKTEEFNLTDKRILVDVGDIKGWFVHEENVKEFIRLLKEKILNGDYQGTDYNSEEEVSEVFEEAKLIEDINNLAGDKLK